MKTVNSLSGGKTSSYIAVHYPADLEVFALVCMDDHNANAHWQKYYKDHGIRQKVNDRLQKYCSDYPEFRATAEDPKTIIAMLDLEQMLGREIIWLRGVGFETMLNRRKFLPNQHQRFCTYLMKIKPIFKFLFRYHELPVRMRIGYRYDEMERKDRYNSAFKYATHCEYRPKSQTWIHRWKEIQYTVGEFPLIDDKITHYEIQQFWKDKDIDFPKDSNCQFCFWKQPQQLRKNFETNAPIMYCAGIHEMLKDATMRKDYSLLEIQKIGIQQDFLFGTGSGCQAGFCTD